MKKILLVVAMVVGLVCGGSVSVKAYTIEDLIGTYSMVDYSIINPVSGCVTETCANFRTCYGSLDISQNAFRFSRTTNTYTTTIIGSWTLNSPYDITLYPTNIPGVTRIPVELSCYREHIMTTMMFDNSYEGYVWQKTSPPVTTPPASGAQTYYVPYFSNENGVICGIAITNYNNEPNSVQLMYYTLAGTLAGSETKNLPKANQDAFVPAIQEDITGWIKIDSSQPVQGLALILGDTAMMDLDFKDSLHKIFIVPQVAANGTEWESILMMCNPNGTIATVTLTCFLPDASAWFEKIVEIPANGSSTTNIREKFARIFDSGYLHISSSQPIAAFMAYDGTVSGKHNWKAGLSAVPLD